MYRIWFEVKFAPEFDEMIGDDVERLGEAQGGSDRFKGIERAQAAIAGGLVYDAAMMKRAPELLVIARTGIGYDKVNVDQATEHGIAVINTPDAPTISTAEFTITLLMGVAKSLPTIQADMRRNLLHSVPRPNYHAIELAELQMGLVGLGRIGGHVAKVALALGMRVHAYDPWLASERMRELGVQPEETLEALLAGSDVVSLHLPLNDGTRKFMNAERFAQMKTGAIFLNASRGGLVDEAALLDVLDSGKLFGAGLDVSDPEPPLADNPLLTHERVILTPHIASSTGRGRHKLNEAALIQVRQVLRGERPPHLLNPEVWPRLLKRWEAMQK